MPDKVEMEGQRYLDDLRRKALSALRFMDGLMEEGDVNEIKVLEFRVSSPDKTGADYRITLKGRGAQGELYVAFGNGSDVTSAITNLKAVCEQRGIYWRDDKPWPRPAASGGTQGT